MDATPISERTPDEVEQLIEEDIVFGRLHPREKLVEETLAARLRTKRHIVRDVLDRLEAAGLVVRIPNRGAFVRELSPQEVIDIYEVREILEVAAAQRTPLPVSKALLESLRDVQQSHSAAMANGDVRTIFYLNIEFHRLQFSACGNAKLATSISDYAKQAHLIRAIKYSEPSHLKQVEAEHRAILRALAGSDRQELMDVVRRHLPASRDAYIRTYALRHGSPVAIPQM